MFVCPTCQREFNTEIGIQHHFLACWKEHNPNHQPNAAPRSEDKVTRQLNDEVANFFALYNKR